MNNTKQKPPYLFGLLCIIPIVGLLTGIIMIFYGIRRYHDKKFTLIGIGGILWTLLGFGITIYYNFYADNAKKSDVGLTDNVLNHVDIGLNAYKQRYGNYPDSLQQLDKIDNLIYTADPMIPIFKEKGNGLLHYKKNNEGYTLYSVGLDGKPNTGDDIYSNGSTK